MLARTGWTLLSSSTAIQGVRGIYIHSPAFQIILSRWEDRTYFI